MTAKQCLGLLSAFCLAWLGSAWARADESTETAAPAAAAAPDTAAQPPDASTIDLAILLDEHMAVLRFQLRRGETPFFQAWQQFMEAKFDAADNDHNGILEAEEFKTVKPLLAAPNGNNRNGNARFRRQMENDTQQIVADPMNDDAASLLGPGVTRDQFIESLRTTTTGPVQIRGSVQPSPASRALFARLDADHDGKLTSGECQHAFEALQPIDFTEVDLFAPFQLTGGNPAMNRAEAAGLNGPRSGRPRLAVKLLRFSNGAPSSAWADRIRQHFLPAGARASTQKNLSRAVMLYDEATFATLDADGDGTLDQEELIHFTRRSVPNLELAVDLSREGAPALTRTRLDPAFRFDSAARTKSSFQPAKLDTGVEEFEMTCDGTTAANQRQGFDLARNLKQFDTDNNDYLEEKELRRFNAVGLMALDANGDGKLFFDEINVYMAAQAEAAAVRLVVTVVDHDHALFDALDANRDGQLGRRELRQLMNCLTAWDRDGDGQLAFEEVPRLYTLAITRDEPRVPGNPFGFGNLYFVRDGVSRLQARSSPAWFIQMDRNSDGDLSRREFLGTAAQFRQLDTDGDQLIDAEEAARAGPAATATVTPEGAEDDDS